MKANSITIKLIMLLTSMVCLSTCKKDFLEVKPAKSLLIPETADDFRALLDNNFVFNQSPALFNNADGDTWTDETGYNGYFLDQERASYTWAADVFGGVATGDWNTPYQQIFYANVVLEGLDKLDPQDLAARSGRDELRGTALFHRAYALFNLSQEFTLPYNPATAGTDPGLPVRLHSDVTEKVGRGTLAGTYGQVIADLLSARKLLPEATTLTTRPGKAAAFAMLSKVYLSMADYPKAGEYADSCLQLSSALIDYNTLNAAATRPFPRALPNGNSEVIFYSLALSYTFSLSASPTVADSVLYLSYATDDLRRSVFFRPLTPGFKFKGNYAGIISLFSGIASDEMYLIRAECSARGGQTVAALSDLNSLLVTRWKSGTFQPFTAPDADAALRLILLERRKELTGRGLRWSDLRRLNSDPRFAVTLRRQLKGQTYTLEPGNKRYTYPIPQDEVRLNGLAQNER